MIHAASLPNRSSVSPPPAAASAPHATAIATPPSSAPLGSPRDRFVATAAGAAVGSTAFGVPAALGSAFGGWGMVAAMGLETASFLTMSRGMETGRPGIAIAGLVISFVAAGAGATLGWPGAIAITALGATACALISARLK